MGCGNSSPAKHVTNNNSSSKRSRDPAEFSSKLSVESVPEDDKRKDQELWRCVRGVAYRPEQHTPSPDWLTQRASDRLAVPQETAVGGLTLVLMKRQACACFTVYGGGMTQREGVC